MIDQFFEKLTAFLENEISTIGNLLDEDIDLFRTIHPRFVDQGCLNLLIPKNLGGLGGERKEWIQYNLLMAQYSGALLFLQGQHQISVSRLKSLLPNPHVEKILQSLSSNKEGIGLGLKKPSYLFDITKTARGYCISGNLPWTTGLDYFSHLLFSFEHNSTLFYTLIPFQTIKKNGGSLLFSPKIETAVFNSINSNSLTFNEWLIDNDQIIASHPITPQKPVVHPSVYNFAGASLALLKEALRGKNGQLPEVKEKHILLKKAWDHYYSLILENKMCPLKLRAQGLKLAERCVLFSRAACGSVSVLKSHSVARLSREIWQYSIAGYSENQLKTYLSEIY